MYGYNPFTKNIGKLEVGDLIALREVPEGWYIEYKQEIPNGKSIAKSLSAFANTYGGWLFYGIKESGDGRRVAEGFPGIPTKDVPAAEQAIRQAASTLVSPAPTFETKILNGPHEHLAIGAGYSVIAIGIPAGNNAPYVHSSGAIYRRVADSSEPRPETDRHFLDLLWQRGKESKKAFDKFTRKKPGFSKTEGDISAVRICFLPDPWDEKQLESKVEFDEFASLMNSPDPNDGGIPFDNVFATRSGYIARQTRNNNPTGTVFSWRYYFDCASEVILPLNAVRINDIADAIKFLKGYEFGPVYLNKFRDHNMRDFHLVDLSQLFSIIYSIMKRKNALLSREGMGWRVFYKVQLSNFWRRVPFVDLQEVASFVDTHGIPVVQDQMAYVPGGRGPESCIQIKPYNDPRFDADAELEIDANVMFMHLCGALGLPPKAFGLTTKEEEGKENTSFTRLFELGQRAQEVTLRRGKSN